MSKRLVYDVFPPPPNTNRDKITLAQLAPELQERWPKVEKELADNPDKDLVEKLMARVRTALSHISPFCHSAAKPPQPADIEDWLNISRDLLNLVVSKIEMTAVER